MAKIVKKATIKRGNVTTVYRNIGSTPEGNPRSIKDLKLRPIKKSPKKKIGKI